MDSKPKVFLTGATGLIGSYLLKILLKNKYRVWVLARSKENKTASERVKEALMFWDEGVLKESPEKLMVLDGDITKKDLGLSNNDISRLKSEINEIFHCAAFLEFNRSLKKERSINLDGTRNVLEFGTMVENLRKITYISTVYVCGKYKGDFKESDLNVGQKFHNTYEQSKFETELLIGEYRKKGLWIDIFRPPLVIGESSTGKVSTFRHLYQILRMWNLETFDVFPGADLSMNVVPVDVLAKSIFISSIYFFKKNKVYHPFNTQLVSFKNVLNVAAEIIGFVKPKLVTYKEFNLNKCSTAQRILLENSMYYLNPLVRLNSEKTNSIFKKFDFSFVEFEEDIFLRALNYLLSAGFLKKNKVKDAH